MNGRDIIGTILIVLGALIILDLFLPFLSLVSKIISMDLILGIILIIIGIFIIKGTENKVEQRKDKKKK